MSDRQHMAYAIRLAGRGIYSTHPNPNVGCVIVNQGAVVGTGWHRQAGGSHAEVFALREAGAKAHGADVFLSLEPCSHQGRTPPCADALVDAGVKRVVVAMQDPNPLVAGQGLERLRAAGIAVETGLLEAQAQALNPGFISRMQRARPWIRVKLAGSLDGRTAMASGESRWITGDAARRDVQRLRARSAAIVTGIGTVLADDPSLNVRLDAAQLYGVEPVRQPLRVVLDTQLRMPVQANMLSLPGATLIITGVTDTDRWQLLQRTGAEVVAVGKAGEQLQPEAVVQLLAERDINEVLLECGPTLAGAFLCAGLVDELVVYIAPHVMGDAARGLFRLPGLERMQDRIALEWLDVRQVGDALRITARPEMKQINR
ncbi:MAG: bifunctional diaminohydroxyphosphoribosylaminopyrimidine deaminase/5-amino-6-(5-phosphoribosylamino)uracil reductase RibD [Gammaproteobacteria bacterium]|nr:MAG: bifunctional diaminohydroxyphosphoribosylaminopyrimidine deaminase/5-amino-6-(5-phosphoribosylamino)uracil reductase RibD [Gammaproteobacteria bacterium]